MTCGIGDQIDLLRSMPCCIRAGWRGSIPELETTTVVFVLALGLNIKLATVDRSTTIRVKQHADLAICRFCSVWHAQDEGIDDLEVRQLKLCHGGNRDVM